VGFRGAIFDVDGVLVDSPHELAWREAFQDLMETEWGDIRDQTTYTPERFTPAVYQAEMSGKPRRSGALAALQFFEVPEAESRADEYGQRKQERVTKLIESGQFHPFADALRFLLAVKGLGIPVAVASSSKNAGLLLKKIQTDIYARAVTGLPIFDTTGGFKCFRRNVLESIDLNAVKSNGYAFQIEMSYRVWKRGFRLVEIPIIFVDRTEGVSKMSKRIVREAVWMVWRLRWWSLTGRI